MSEYERMKEKIAEIAADCIAADLRCIVTLRDPAIGRNDSSVYGDVRDFCMMQFNAVMHMSNAMAKAGDEPLRQAMLDTLIRGCMTLKEKDIPSSGEEPLFEHLKKRGNDERKQP